MVGLRGRRQPLRPADHRRGRRRLPGGEGGPRPRGRDPRHRRQAAALLGGGAVPHPAAPRDGARACACAAAARSATSRVRSEATSTPRRSARSASTRSCAWARCCEGQPAEAAGLRTDDAILSIDGQPLRSLLRDPADRARGRAARACRSGSGGTARRSTLAHQRPRRRLGPAGRDRARRPCSRSSARPGAVAEAARWTWDMTTPDLRRARPPRHRPDLAEDHDGPARDRPGLGRRGARRRRARCSSWWR